MEKDLEDKNGHLINKEGKLVYDARCSFCVDEMHEQNKRRQEHGKSAAPNKPLK